MAFAVSMCAGGEDIRVHGLVRRVEWVAAGAPSNFDKGDFAAKERQLSYGSAFAAVPTAPLPICRHATELLSNDTRQCGSDEQEVGVACAFGGCGRPIDWPANKPFFMPLNYTNAGQWLNLGMGLAQYRRAAGRAPTTTNAEFAFLQVRCVPRAPSLACLFGALHLMWR